MSLERAGGRVLDAPAHGGRIPAVGRSVSLDSTSPIVAPFAAALHVALCGYNWIERLIDGVPRTGPAPHTWTERHGGASRVSATPPAPVAVLANALEAVTEFAV